MSGPEVVHRVREAVRKQMTRRTLQGWAHYPHGQAIRPSLPGLQARIDQAPAPTKQAIAASAAALRAGQFEVLGTQWPEGTFAMDFPASIWTLDPRTGRSWPGAEHFCFDIPYRMEAGIGDVKYVWELGRLQFLPVLAADARLHGNADSALAVQRAIDSWYEHNPPFGGVHWAELLNVAIRAINLLVAVSILGDQLPDRAVGRVRAMLAAHARLLSLFPSLYSSANNHLVAERAAEYLIAVAAPDLPTSAYARGMARSSLIDEAARQILADGWPAEQSPSYGAFTAEFLLLVTVVAQSAGEAFPETVLSRLQSFADQIQCLANGTASVPALGDNDEGRVMTLCHHESRYPMSVASCICAVNGQALRSLLRPEASLRDAVFGIPALGPPVGDGQFSFPLGGCSVDRRRIAGRDCLLTFDHGPLGYLSIAAHGHADALAITLDVDGHPLLVDPGTYLYHSGGKWRDWFRGTRAHNTLCLNSTNQSHMAGPFNWTRKATARLEDAESGTSWRWVASHDGYQQGFGLRHQRTVLATADGYTLVDRLLGSSAEQAAEVVFQIGLGFDAVCDGNTVLLHANSGGPLVAKLEFDALGEVSARRGGDIGEGGWVSPRFGVREAAWQVVWVGKVPDAGAVVRIRLLPTIPDGPTTENLE
ncbi:MAG: heparinase II/III-family protein [Burkholderiales bacterium]|nr:heparinase II/III-family protein [Burkholderiales bacterium]